MIEEENFHPITIFFSLKNLLFLLIFPLSRGLITAITGGTLASWLADAKSDFIIIVLGVLLIIFSWSQKKYIFQKNILIFKKGIIKREIHYVAYDKISTITLAYPFILKYFGVVKLVIDTPAGTNIKSDFTIYIHKKDAKIISNIFLNKNKYVNKLGSYKPKNIYIAFFSALLSNSAMGMIIVYTFFSQGGKILGRQFESIFFNTFSTIMNLLATGTPIVLGVVGLIFVFGWLVSFIRVFLRYLRFEATRMETGIHISSGIFSHMDNFLQINNINYIDIRQNILTKIIRLNTTYLHCVGYEKSENVAPVFIPAASEKETYEILGKYLKEFKMEPVKIKPKNLFNIRAYITNPLVFLLVSELIIFILYKVLLTWQTIIFFLGIIILIPILWILLIKIYAFFSSGYAISKDILTVKYSSTFSLHTVIMPISKISNVSILEKKWHKKRDLCDVIFYSYSENRKKHVIKAVSKSETEKYLNNYSFFK